ncbi:MAG: HNH endonuclease signature motif containing protein [Bacteroidales bacterium]
MNDLVYLTDGTLLRNGKPLGYLEKSNGYLRFTRNKKKYYVHRVIYQLHHGQCEGEVDHINQDKTDNRIENLRLVTHQDNNRNKPRNSNNTTGATGVYWNKRSSKWIAKIMVDRKDVHLGTFTHFEDAVTCRKSANVQYGFSELHGS